MTTDEDYASPHPGLLHMELARRQLGISRASLWRLIKAGEVAYLIHARRAWVPQNSINDYFARRIAEASTAANQCRAKQKTKRRTGTKAPKEPSSEHQ